MEIYKLARKQAPVFPIEIQLHLFFGIHFHLVCLGVNDLLVMDVLSP